MKRLGPTWLRSMSTDALHALGMRMLNTWRNDGLSERQEWLLDRVSYELGWRMTKRLPMDRCTCRLCIEPFVVVLGRR